MTYCLAISTDHGLVFCSDSRTNAGVDQISTYSKMHKFGNDGERQFVVLSSGNLATTQGVINQAKNDIQKSAPVNLMNVPCMNDAAAYIGELIKFQEQKMGGGPTFEATLIIGGQIMGEGHKIFLVYPQGNYITTSRDTLFLQIGESKYGKPILDRILTSETDLDTAALCALVSMDSTMRSNLTVGPPLEIQFYEANSFLLSRYYRFDEESEYLRELKRSWDLKLVEAFSQLPPLG